MTSVYDYVAGKSDWLARGLPTEGESTRPPRAIDALANDAVTCGLEDRVGEVAERVARSRYDFALVLSVRRILLGRAGRASLTAESADLPVADVMEPGPSTIRASAELEQLSERMDKTRVDALPVTTPDGELLGIARREDV